MIELIKDKLPRQALFLAFNAFAVLFLVLFAIAPIWTHFASRSEDISESAAQLLHLQRLIRTRTLVTTTSQAGDPFLPGNEERVVSADLQASLKTAATVAGVRLLGIRGLQGSRNRQLHMVAASVEIEGPLPAIRSVILAIENQTPFLFVTAASLRSLTDGDEGLIRAELKVQGAMQDSGPAIAPEATSQ
jgi:hypothetical protein